MKKLLFLIIFFPFFNAKQDSLPSQNVKTKPDKLVSNGDWAHYGYDGSNSKFSPLDIISTNNIGQLKEAWHYQETVADGSNIFFNPLIINGKMIALMPSKKLVALNALNGQLLWEFMPDSSEVVFNWNRGITYNAGKNGKPDALLFVFGTTLYSINATNGKVISSFGKNGRIDFYTGLSVPKAMRKKVEVTSNAPGIIFNDLFIIGCKVPDELPSTAGDIRAFNVHTGKLEWIFHTIPQKGEFGADTWAADARLKNGGANSWCGLALDEKRGIVYVPTASPSFDFYGADRPGMNLFANCLVALDAKTGKRLWHFQTTHHDLWDRDNGSPPNLVTVEHEGKKIDAVALVTKTGYLFLFHRVTGEPLFPIEEVPVPTKSLMPGEKPWPTQPIPTKPPPFARQGFKKEYFTSFSPEIEQYFKQQVETNNYDTGIYDPPNLNGSVIVPAAQGGANWGGASFNPNSGVLFVNSSDMPWFLKLKEIKDLSVNNNLSGENLYKISCAACHGKDRKGTNVGPNLILKSKLYSAKKIETILKKGAEPMPSFKHLPPEQLQAIIAYLKGIPVEKLAKNKASKTIEHVEPYGFSGYDFFQDTNGIPALKPPFGTLNAIDLNKGEILWQVPLGEDKKLAKMGMPQSGLYSRGGGIATAGDLIFIAATGDDMFRAFDQKTGKIVWETQLPGSGTAIPATYAINQKQYVTIAVSPNYFTGYKGGYLTFSIN
jgi:quinoprotein glucose dehydrogenase